MKKLTFIVLIGLFFTSQALAQSLTLSSSCTEVPVGETFVVTLTLEGAKSTQKPDFKPLEQNFKVYSVSNSFLTQSINGKLSQSQEWSAVLMATEAGNVTISPIKLDNLESNALSVKILNPSEKSSETNANDAYAPQFKIFGNINNSSPFVQEQIIYTLTIQESGGLEGQEPSFIGLNEQDWMVKKISEPKISSKIINGKNLREIEFKYAFFPLKSGKLTIPPAEFNGYYLTQKPQRNRMHDPFADFFGNDFMSDIGFGGIFADKTPIALRSKLIELEVKPVPAENDGAWWLPSAAVKLYAVFEPENPSFKVGEAVNRTIYLTAEGVVDSQLPDILFPPVNGIKQYPEKAVTENMVKNGQIVAIKKISNVYIPASEGNFILPPISVKWFNLNRGTIETAVIPALLIMVKPGTAVSVQNSTEQVANALMAPAVQKNTNQEKTLAQEWSYIMVGAAFLLGILVSYLIFRFKKNNSNNISYKKEILKLAKKKDLRALRDMLLEWGRNFYHKEKIINLKDLGKWSENQQFAHELDNLMKDLYSENSHLFDERNFRQGFAEVLENIKGKTQDDPLPELYK